MKLTKYSAKPTHVSIWERERERETGQRLAKVSGSGSSKRSYNMIGNREGICKIK